MERVSVVLVLGSGGNNDALGVTWSLAIEEQFYMVWPLIVFVCQAGTLKRLCVGLLCGSLLLRVALLLMGQRHDVLYELTPCRFDAIALGSLFAVLVRERGVAGVRSTLMPHVPWVASASAIVIAAMCAVHKMTSWDGPPGQAIGYTAVAVFFSCIFLATLTAREDQWFNWIFTRPWLMFFGRYSYALYLFHYPVSRVVQDYVYGEPQFLRFGGSRIPGVLIFTAICTAISVVMALLSWNLLEKHCLALKRYFPTHSKEKSSKPATAVLAAEASLESQQAVA
jgi:peptidoglycan/LPS O-acetylase OafA/YrhL